MTDPSKRARAAWLEAFREKKIEAGDLERIYDRQYTIATSETAEHKDAINAAKNCEVILGVSRPGPEKPPEAPKQPTSPQQQVAPLSDDRINDILKKLGK